MKLKCKPIQLIFVLGGVGACIACIVLNSLLLKDLTNCEGDYFRIEMSVQCYADPIRPLKETLDVGIETDGLCVEFDNPNAGIKTQRFDKYSAFNGTFDKCETMASNIKLVNGLWIVVEGVLIGSIVISYFYASIGICLLVLVELGASALVTWTFVYVVLCNYQLNDKFLKYWDALVDASDTLCQFGYKDEYIFTFRAGIIYLILVSAIVQTVTHLMCCSTICCRRCCRFGSARDADDAPMPQVYANQYTGGQPFALVAISPQSSSTNMTTNPPQ